MPPFQSRSSRSSVTEENVSVVVKWFNAEKGYGFVSLTDGRGEVFLHISALSGAGYESVPEGATLICDLSQGPKGPQVAAVHEVDTSTASPSRGKGSGGPRGAGGPPREDRRDRYAAEPAGGGEPQAGTVKFFDAARGFGFIARAQGGPDVFVHATALSRAGLAFPQTGQAVRFTTRPGKKGEEVAEIEFD